MMTAKSQSMKQDKACSTCDYDSRGAHISYYHKKRVPTLDKETWSNDSLSLMSKMITYLPWWGKQRTIPSTTSSYCHCAIVKVQSNQPCHVEYSDEDDIIEAKKQIIEAEKKARKHNKRKIQERKKTYKRYKMKAREIEKKVKIIEKEKIKRKQEALRKAHRFEKEKLFRETQLLKEKEKLERLELKNREKNVKNHMKSLKRKLRAKCESIYYDSEEPSEELSESSSLGRIHPCRKSNTTKRQRRKREEYNCSKKHLKHGNEEHDDSSHTGTDEEVARILNALLDTNVQFDPAVIAKIKTLMKKNRKIQGYFDECRRNNLAHQLKYKLFNRIGPDSKLKLFLNSKKKFNLNNENRELVRCILDQINRAGGIGGSGETAPEKICKGLWKSGENETGQISTDIRDKEVTVTNVPQTANNHQRANKRSQRDGMRIYKEDHLGKKQVTEKSLRPVNSIDLTKKKLTHSKEKKKRGDRKTNLRQKVKKCIRRFTDRSKTHSKIHETKPFYLNTTNINTMVSSNIQPCSDESDLELELSNKCVDMSPRSTSPPTAQRFTLWQYFQKTNSKGNVSRDKEHEEGRCKYYDKATETDNDVDTDYTSNTHDERDYQTDLESSEQDTKKRINFWTLFNTKREKGSVDNVETYQPQTIRQRQRRKTVWTNK